MSEAFTVSSGSAELAGERGGAGASAVFLHAGVADKRMWRGQLGALPRDYLVAAYDRRGFGKTTYKDDSFSHTDDLRAVLAALDLESATLVGCSQGGRIAIDFALAHLQRVSGLVLVAPAVSGQPEPTDVPAPIKALWDDLERAEDAGDLARVNQLEAHLWLDGPLSSEGRVGGELRELFLDMNGTALRAPETREQDPPSAYERLGELAAPTLVLWGDLDFLHVGARCRHLAKTIPNAQVQEIAGTAHLPSLEQPETFNRALLSFLEDVQLKEER